MAVLCCVTASKLHVEETRSTLKFASRAQLVQTTAKVNEIVDDSALIKKLQNELAEATRALKELEKRETTLESIIFTGHPSESDDAVQHQSYLLNTSVSTQTSFDEDDGAGSQQSPQQTDSSDESNPVHGLTASPTSRISAESEPLLASVTPDSEDDTANVATRLNRSMESSMNVLPPKRMLKDPITTSLCVADEPISPVAQRRLTQQRTSTEPPSEVVILMSGPPPPSIAPSEKKEGDMELQSRLQDADERTQFLQSKLDATEDLVESLFKDIESARRCIHELVFKNVNLARRIERLRRKIDEQASQYKLVKHAIYCGLVFYLFGRHEIYLATVMFLWLTLEVIT
jgi:hypothetical protein